MDNELLDGFFLKDLFVEPVTGEVTTPSGQVHLPSKAMEVLLYLARHPRRLVTREELITAVWGDGHGSADTLTHAVSDIRHALSDHASTPVFIQTVPTRGYRLLVEPAPATQPPSAPLSRSKRDVDSLPFWQALVRHGVVQAAVTYLVAGWLLIQVADATFETIGLPPWGQQFVTFMVIGGFPIVILLAWFLEFTGGEVQVDEGQSTGGMFEGLGRNYLAIFFAYGIAAVGAGVYQGAVGFEERVDPQIDLIPVADNSLAVLRLLTIGDDEVLRVFTDGLSEDLIDALAKLPGLSVSSRGDSWSLPENATSDMVRERLRVAHFVEGSVRSIDADSLRVVVQLVDSATGFHVVSRGFDFALEDFENLEKEIVGLVVANLRIALDLDMSDVEIRAADATKLDAFIAYRRGLEQLYRPRSREALDAAMAYFNDALRFDAEYPAAHAGLCSAHTVLFGLSRDPEDIRAAEAACAQAFSVGSQLPLVLNAVGQLYLATGENDDAEAMFREAIQKNEQYVPAIKGLAVLRERQLDFGEAEELLRRAIELQPGNWQSFNTLGNLYFGTGRWADAVEQYEKVLFLDSDNTTALGNLGGARLMLGDFDAARQAIERSLEIDYDSWFASNLGIVYYYRGDFARSVETHRRVIDLAPNSAGSWVNLGDALYHSGNLEDAQAAFSTALELAQSDLGVNPDDPEALTYVAWSLAMTGDTSGGLQSAERAVAIDPSDPYSHYYVALIRTRTGQSDAAIDALESALDNGYEATLLAAEPYLRPLKANPRFDRLLARHGIRGE
ncbi:MAG: tetratricopeptide repeat protein [Woeseiaceae bacterium]|nr:tetratricopeptide repeat protein [Woeseiaceae bacterium]